MSSDVETVVIGAGVVGLAIAAALAEIGQRVLVLEQHDAIGTETSSRNSEVVHAGLYYPRTSLKALLCLEGRDMLYRFARENGVAAPRIGKLIVATEPSDVAKLDAIAMNARRCGIRDLVRLDAAGVREVEPELHAVAGVLSPTTGIIDGHGLMLALDGRLQASGGEIALASRVTSISHQDAISHQDGGGLFTLDVVSGGTSTRLTAQKLVIAAGLHASRLAGPLFAGCGYQPPPTYFAKGHYYSYARATPFSHLVYPLPADGGLGVHLTLDTAGGSRFGPDVSFVDAIDYAFDDPDGSRKRDFASAIRRWWPALEAEALQPGFTGIRPKLARRGEADADFAIDGPATHGLEGLVALYGIESPGLTSCLAIARHVALLLAD